jgi:phosphomannomutase
MFTDDLRARASAWIADDPDEQDKAELAGLLADDTPEAAAELADRFAGRLSFGTAGLRAAVAAGPNRMNSATVTAATAALAGWLSGRDPAAAAAGVVVGCDARHRSEEFAAQAGRVLAGAGIRVHMLPSRVPTPFLAFAVRQLRAAAGVMITASHNPAGDNGYKVYLGDGAQIGPPADTDIDAAIAGLGPLSAVPAAPLDSALISWPGEEVTQAYLDAICTAIGPAPASAAWLRFVYTPLHGVAGRLALRAFEQAGYAAPDVVAAQLDPDPDFPTVTFPNPEEPGALDLALAQARRTGADLVLANDPDGDRLAVAVPDPDAPGGYRQLTCDQVGALLGRFLLGRLAAESGTAEPGTGMAGQLAVSTVVSSSLLAKIAAAAGAQYAQTLTGFKWLVRSADLRDDVRFAFGYEEALGYAVTDAVRDKDGISAALAVLSLAAVAWSAGESLQDAYDALEIEHGVHLTAQLSRPAARTVDAMSRLRAAAPAELAGQPVLSVTDYSGGSWDLPSADMLSYRLPDARVVIRPSGTEPKIRAYLEVVQPVLAGQLRHARDSAAGRMAGLTEAVEGLLAS